MLRLNLLDDLNVHPTIYHHSGQVVIVGAPTGTPWQWFRLTVRTAPRGRSFVRVLKVKGTATEKEN